MRSFTRIWIAVIFVFGVFADEEGHEEDGVASLGTKNFQRFLENNDHVFVMFYANWCRWCEAAAPEFAKAAEKLAAMRRNVKFGKVDVDAEDELATENDVSFMPTLRFYSGDNRTPIEFFNTFYWEAVNYPGEHKADDMVAWIVEQIESSESISRDSL